MATIANLVALLTLTDDLTGELEKAKSKVEKIGKGMTSVGRSLSVGLTAPLVGVGALMFKAGLDFDAAMANVNSIAQLSEDQLGSLSDQVVDLAQNPAITQGPAELADGLYNIYSSGFQGADGMKVLEAAALAATAGLTTTDTSARAITAVLNAYGLQASEAGRISDLLFQTVNDGVITFEELSNNIGSTIPLANSLGVSLEDLFAAYAQLTLQGINASAAETDIAALMKTALAPTEALTAAVQAQGFANAQTALETLGLGGYVKLMEDYAASTGLTLMDLIGTQEGVNAALALGGDNAGKYAEEVDKMGHASDGAGATQTALAKQMESLQFKIDKAKQSFAILGTTLFGIVAPAATAIADKLSNLFLWLNKLSPAMQTVIVVVAGVAAALGPMLVILGSVIGAVSSIGAAFGAGGALAGLTALLGPIALVVGALAGLGIAYKTNLFGFRDGVNKVAGAIASPFKKIKDRFDHLNKTVNNVMGRGFVDPMGNVVGLTNQIDQSITGIERTFTALGQAIEDVTGLPVAGFFAELGRSIQRPLDGIMKVWDGLGKLNKAFQDGGLKGGLKALFGGVGKQIAAGIGDTIASVPKAIGKQLLQIKTGFAPVDRMIQATGQHFVDMGRLVQEVFQGDISGALKVAKRMLLRSITAPIKNVLKTIDSVLGTNLTGWASKTFAPVGKVVDSVFGSLDKSLNGMVGRFKKSFGKMGDAAGDIFKAFKKGGISGAMDALFGKSGRKLLAGFGDGLAAIPKAIGSFVGGIKTGIGPVDAVLSGVGSTISDLGRLVQEVFQLDFKGAGDVAERIFLRIGNAVYDLLDWFGDLIGVDLLGWAEKAAGPLFKIWSGIKAIAGSAIDALKGALKGLLGRWGKAFGKMGDAIDDIKDAFKKGGIQGALKSIFGKAGRKLLEGFGDAVSAVPKAFGDFFRNFKTGFAPLDNVLGKFADVFTDIGRLIQEIFQGDFKGALEVGKRLLGDFWDLIKTTFSSMGDTLKAAFSAIPWSDLWDGAKAIGGKLLGAIGDLGQKIYDWIADKLSLVDWALLWELAKARMSEELAKLTDMASEIAAKVLGWLQKAIGIVVSLAGVVFNALAPVITSIATKVGEWIIGLPWADIGAKILEWLQKAIGLVVTLAVIVFNALAPIATALFNKVVEFFTNLDYAAIGSKILEWLQKAINLVVALAVIIFQSLAPIATSLFNKVVGFFTGLDVVGLGVTILGWLYSAVKWFVGTYIAVYTLLANLAIDFLSYVLGLFTGLDFVGLGVTVLGWLYSAVKWFVGTYIAVYSLLGNLALDLLKYVLNLFTGLDFVGLGITVLGWFYSAVKWFVETYIAIYSLLGNLALDLAKYVLGLFTDLDFVSIGTKIYDWVYSAVSSAVASISGAVLTWAGWISGGLKFVLSRAGEIVSALPNAFAGLGSMILGWIEDQIPTIDEIKNLPIVGDIIQFIDDPVGYLFGNKQETIESGYRRVGRSTNAHPFASNIPGLNSSGPADPAANLANAGNALAGGSDWSLPALDLTAFTASVESVPDLIGTNLDEALQLSSTIAAGMQTALGVQFDRIKSEIQSKTDPLPSIIGGALDRSLQLASVVANAISTNVSAAIGKMVGNVTGRVNTLPGIVGGALNTMAVVAGGAAYNAGAVTSFGFANGINAGMPAVIAAVDGLAAQAERALQARLRINSPSRVFHDLGVQVGKGFVDGIESGFDAAARAGRGLADAATPSYAPGLFPHASVIAGAHSGGQSGPVIDGRNFGRIDVWANDPDDMYAQMQAAHVGQSRPG